MSRMQGRAARFAIVLGLVAACGGDDNSSTGVVTGLPTTQKLSTLSDDDLKQACRNLAQAADKMLGADTILRGTCVQLGIQAGLTINGAGITVDISKCQQSVDACVSSASESTTVDDDFECDSASMKDAAGCDVTVGEYEACFNRFLNDLHGKLVQLTCENAETAYANEDSEPSAAMLPECEALATKCPDAELGIPLK